jgi:hypothetical protein
MLNRLTKADLEALGVKEWTLTIIELEKIILMDDLISSTQKKCIATDRECREFQDQFTPYIKLGLPSPWTTEGKIFPFDSYEDELKKKKGVKQVVDIKEKFHVLNGKSVKMFCFQILNNELVLEVYYKCKLLFVIILYNIWI